MIRVDSSFIAAGPLPETDLAHHYPEHPAIWICCRTRWYNVTPTLCTPNKNKSGPKPFKHAVRRHDTVH